MLLFGCGKLYAIPLDLVAPRVELDLAKQNGVPLCMSYESETSNLVVPRNGRYSLDRRPRAVMAVRDEERFITLSVWKHEDEDSPWGATLSIGHRPNLDIMGKLTGQAHRPAPQG